MHSLNFNSWYLQKKRPTVCFWTFWQLKCYNASLHPKASKDLFHVYCWTVKINNECPSKFVSIILDIGLNLTTFLFFWSLNLQSGRYTLLSTGVKNVKKMKVDGSFSISDKHLHLHLDFLQYDWFCYFHLCHVLKIFCCLKFVYVYHFSMWSSVFLRC